MTTRTYLTLPVTPSEPQMFVGDEIRKKLGTRRKPATLAAAENR